MVEEKEKEIKDKLFRETLYKLLIDLFMDNPRRRQKNQSAESQKHEGVSLRESKESQKSNAVSGLTNQEGDQV